ncbi:RraA family protein [Pasteurellaceae bacterium 22721_9_1]
MQNPGFKIVKDFSRVEKDKIEQLRSIPVTILGDSSNRTACCSNNMFATSKNRLLGSAYTVRVPAGDNLLFYYAIENAKAGDVIVVDGEGYTGRALCGEIMVEYAKQRGIAGIVVYGAIRDKQDVSDIGLPVFACATNPNGPYKNGPGEINVPVNIAGKTICPGDILVGDENGVIAIKPEYLDTVLVRSKEIIEKEKQMLDEIRTHKKLNLSWLHKKLADSQCEFIEEA